MSYLLRVVLPDRPGALGALATALGEVGADIQSLVVVERGAGGAVDDLVVELPAGAMPDALVSAATAADAVVESVRPYPGGKEVHDDLTLVDELVGAGPLAAQRLAERAPGLLRAGWAAVLGAGDDGRAQVQHASAGAPEDLGQVAVPWVPLAAARRLGAATDADASGWVPERWQVLGTELVAAPLGRPDVALLLARPGGPAFRQREVVRLAHLAGLAATVATTAAIS